jgi:hypothetical protein
MGGEPPKPRQQASPRWRCRKKTGLEGITTRRLGRHFPKTRRIRAVETTHQPQIDRRRRLTRNIVRPTAALAAIVAMNAAVAGAAAAEVLYDTTSMTDTQTYTYSANVQSYIGGSLNNSGTLRDEQICDDFVLVKSHRITSVTADFLCLNATPPITPAGGVLIEIFSDSSGTPQETPIGQYLATGSEITATTFNNTLGGTTYNPLGIRFTIDLSGAGIVLAPGTWWLSVVGVDETANGRRYYYVSKAGVINGLQDRRRNGGMDHGNGYPGTAAGPDWALATAREVAMKVEGARLGDTNGDNIVDIDDLLIVINAWGTCKAPCAADVAPLPTGNGVVDIDDLLVVINDWD